MSSSSLQCFNRAIHIYQHCVFQVLQVPFALRTVLTIIPWSSLQLCYSFIDLLEIDLHVGYRVSQ